MVTITIQFDKKAIKEHKVQTRLGNYFEWDSIPLEVSNIVLKKIPSSVARQYISTYHYSHIMPDSSKEIFAGYIGNKIAGIIVYGTGASNEAFTSLFKNISLKNVRELVRLWSPDNMPKNTESVLISKSLRLLPKNVKVILSFADPTHKHIGIIYQATNFYYLGMTNPSKMLIDTDGNIFHIRTIGSYKRRHPEIRKLTHREIMAKYQWFYVDRKGKYKYLYLRGTTKERKQMLKSIKDKILPYPKYAKEVSRADTPVFQTGRVGAIPTLRIE